MNLIEDIQPEALTPPTGAPPSPDDPRVVRALEEYSAALKAGQNPDRHEFQARYPEVAEALAECLEGLEFVQAAAPLLQPPGGSVPAAASGAAAEFCPEGTLGDFRIVRELGRGGMGVVYEAVQISLGRPVALKVLPFAAALDAKQLQRFKNEAQAAAHLHHTNIVPVISVGYERGVHYYAMQFIDGHSLAALISELRRQGGRGTAEEPRAAGAKAALADPAASERKATVERKNAVGPSPPPPAPVPPPASTTGGPLPPYMHPYSPAPLPPGAAAGGTPTLPEAGLGTLASAHSAASFRTVANLGVQAAEALEHAHGLGVVHRDIKPANLLVDGRGNLWVTDFGLAHMQSQAGLTMTGDLVGTLRYMSPEQALAKRVLVDHRTDIYSLGASLYELVTLEPVFSGPDRQELLRQIAFEEPKPPRRLNKAIPPELETIILKAVEKNPADRYATAQELADDLGRFLRDEPIRARPPSLVQRARKWARRHKPVVWAAALMSLLVALMAGGSGLWFMQKRAETAGAVNEALNKATELQKEGKWPEALVVAQRAEALLQLGGGSPVLQHRVEELVKDLQMVADLEEIRLLAASAVTDDHFDSAGADGHYARKFAQYGIDLKGLEPGEAARRIQASAIKEQLVAAVDDWFWDKQNHGIAGGEGLGEVSRQADPAMWRDQLRRALASKDKGAVERLVRSGEVVALPAGRVVLLAGAFARAGKLSLAVEVLRQAQRRHPGDFWINHYLAAYLLRLGPSQVDEAIRFFTAAVALRPHSPGAHLNLGTALFDRGKLDEAIAAFRECIRLKPDYTMAHNNLGVALERKGKLDQAISEFRKAIRLKPDFAMAHFHLGSALKRKGKLDEAIAEYRQAIRFNRDYPGAHNNLGNALFDKGKLDEAIAAYREAIRLKPDLAVAHNNLGYALKDKGKVDEAIAEWRQAIRLQKDFKDFPGAHYSLGIALKRKGKLDEAIAEYRQAIRLNSDYLEAHYNLGIALHEQRKHAAAEVEFRQALRLRPDYPEAHYYLGIALHEQRKHAAAEAEFREALRLRPEDPEAHYNLGIALHKQRKHAEAVAELRQALRLRPDMPDLPAVRLNLGAALHKQGKHGEAEVEFREALRLRPDFPEALYNLGNALGNQGKYGEAEAKFREALRLRPDLPLAHNNLGITLSRLRKHAEAEAEFRKAMRLRPDDPGFHCDLGNALGNQGKHRAAEAEFREALRLRPDYPVAHFKLGIALYKQGKHAAAAAEYAAAFTAEPKLADDLRTQHRCNAACAAALAGCGQGEDTGQLDEKERARLRRQALAWLRADLAAWGQFLEKEPNKARAVVRETLRHWQQDADFAGLRGDALAKLPEPERQPWRKLWAEVEQTLKNANAKYTEGTKKKPSH